MSVNSQIRDRLVASKPNMSASTLKTYTSLLTSLYLEDHSKNSTVDFDWFKNHIRIKELIINRPLSSQKTIFSGLIAIAPLDTYRENVMEINQIQIENNADQEKSEKQQENWLDWKDIVNVVSQASENIKPVFAKKEWDANDLSEVSSYMLLALASGFFIPPRRSTDYAEMKLRNYNTQNDNYYENGVFHFNTYKTANTYGKHIIKITGNLKKLMNIVVKRNPNDYLLVNTNGGKLFTSSITQRLNKFFDNKKISTSMLRHIFLSHVHEKTPSLRELKKLAKDMGHSVEMGMEYAKK
jgi:integrase